jgi:hypothetical protein
LIVFGFQLSKRQAVKVAAESESAWKGLTHEVGVDAD